MLLCVWVIFKEKERDPILIAMLAALLMLGAYCFIGFPEWLARLTLLSFTTQRAIIAVGLLQILMLIRSRHFAPLSRFFPACS